MKTQPTTKTVNLGTVRWITEGWRAHIADARHENHVANSFAKHAGDFGPAWSECLRETIARIVAFGRHDDTGAATLIFERICARAAKAENDDAAARAA